ncbi:MAG: hypothetical protein NUV57_03520 [archaeon]|nr:hypothetical protein [archaeon]
MSKTYDPTKLKPMKKVFFLVHPYWGYYGTGRTIRSKKNASGYAYDPMPDNQLYANLLEHEWHQKEFPEFLQTSEAIKKIDELTRKIQAKKIAPVNAEIEWGKFVMQRLSKATPDEVEQIREKSEKLYKKAVDDAAKRKDSLFVAITNPSVNIFAIQNKELEHSLQLTKREHEMRLLRYAREKLGGRLVVIQEKFKPVGLFRIITARGFKLTKGVEVEAFGETAEIINGKSCVSTLLGEFIEALPNMSKHVEEGNIFVQKEKSHGTMEILEARMGHPARAIISYPDGSYKEIKPATIPEGVKVTSKKPPRVSPSKPLIWINPKRSGIPIQGLPKLARQMRRR